jgi:hypothetical protein
MAFYVGMTAPQPAWMLGWESAQNSHGYVSSPRQRSFVALACDSCCRGFESHQPPQYLSRFRAIAMIAMGTKTGPHGNTP